VTSQAAGATDVRAAYQHCEQVTRTQARNFSYGIRLLPGGKRRALSAVYAFARRIDDIGDGTLPAADKLAALRDARGAVAALEREGIEAAAGDPVLVALADAARRYPIPLGAFGELIDGCEADVRGTSYATFGELEHYCRCVAGSIGRLSLGVFGSRDPGPAEPLADSLGIALQLTNILRDVREDLINGRVYLPAEDLGRFGAVLRPDRADALADSREVQDVVRFEARRALGWYATGMRLLPLLDRRSAACTGAMAGIYLRLLEQIAAAPAAALRQRQSLPGKEKAMVAARALAGIADRVPDVGSPRPDRPGDVRPAGAAGGPAPGGPAGGPGSAGPVAAGPATARPAAAGSAARAVAGGPAAAGPGTARPAAVPPAAAGPAAGGRP
jgi:15-cis-phytoene synthase